MLTDSFATLLFGRYAERNLIGSLICLGASPASPWCPLQTLMVDEVNDAANLASALNRAAFNLGNASSAALGGLLIHLRLGLPVVALAGAAISAIGRILVLLFNRYRKAGLVTA